ncbi:hypothetical protein FGB62_243g05 [Gracilaria domingensis]|nr:hypothetical protein FGB62_243g05 [Gracilaria domingensis]
MRHASIRGLSRVSSYRAFRDGSVVDTRADIRSAGDHHLGDGGACISERRVADARIHFVPRAEGQDSVAENTLAHAQSVRDNGVRHGHVRERGSGGGFFQRRGGGEGAKHAGVLSSDWTGVHQHDVEHGV